MPECTEVLTTTINGDDIILDDYFTREVIKKYNWFSINNHLGRHVMRGDTRTTLYLATVLWERYNGRPVPEGLTVDHADQNPKNNLPENLRLATRGQQKANNPKRKDNKSGYIGVRHTKKVKPNGKTYEYWMAENELKGRLRYKCFPYTEQGKLQAASWINQQYATDYPEVKLPNPGV